MITTVDTTLNNSLHVWTPNSSPDYLRSSYVDAPRYTTIDGVTYKIADCREEREAAFGLVYDAYTETGLIPENPFRMRVTRYHLSPLTTVFLAIHEGKPVYTVTLVPDDDLGMPLDDLYQEETDEMRARDMYLAEVSCLAGDADAFDRRRRFDIFVNLMGLMAQHARQQEVHRLLVAVHPRHAKFYQHFLGFEVMGEEKSYDSVNGAPALGCFHDFDELDRTRYRLYDKVYAHPFLRWELLCQPMSRADRDYFEPMTKFSGCNLLPMAA